MYFQGIRAHLLDASLGLVDINEDFLLARIFLGLRRLFPATPRPKAPVLPHHLRAFRDRMDLRNPLHARDWALFLICFFGFLRRSEAVALRLADVSFVGGHLELNISSSKTSRFPVRLVLSQRNDALCPVAALRHYLSLLPLPANPAAASALPLFRSLVGNTLTSRGISKARVSTRLKTWIDLLGLPSGDFGGHSLRRGGATTAAMSGVPDRLIQLHGRWVSDAYRGYIDEPLHSRLAVTSQPLLLSLAHPSSSAAPPLPTTASFFF